jgi:hypothetical protein
MQLSFRRETAWQLVGFEALTEVTMKISVFWITTVYSPVSVNRRFGGTCCLYLQCRWASHAINQRRASANTSLLHALFFLGLIFYSEHRGRYLVSKRRFTSTTLHGVSAAKFFLEALSSLFLRFWLQVHICLINAIHIWCDTIFSRMKKFLMENDRKYYESCSEKETENVVSNSPNNGFPFVYVVPFWWI